MCGLLSREDGVTMVEATLGIVMMLFITLFAFQVVLFLHGSLAAHTAAARAARSVALAGDPAEANAVFAIQKETGLRSLSWEQESCTYESGMARCIVELRVPAIMPGAPLFFGGGDSLSAISVREEAQYPGLDYGG